MVAYEGRLVFKLACSVRENVSRRCRDGLKPVRAAKNSSAVRSENSLWPRVNDSPRALCDWIFSSLAAKAAKAFASACAESYALLYFPFHSENVAWARKRQQHAAHHTAAMGLGSSAVQVKEPRTSTPCSRLASQPHRGSR